jgi:hypothetical protein
MAHNAGKLPVGATLGDSPMGIIASVIAAFMEIAGVGTIGYALIKSGVSGHEIHSSQIQTLSGPIEPFEINLDPSMSPVAFRFSARVASSHHPRMTVKETFSYSGTLALDRKPMVQLSMPFDIEPEEKSGKERSTSSFGTTPRLATTAHPKPFDVPAAGRYRFTAVPASKMGDIRVIQDMDVSVRRNVTGVDTKKVWWGVGLIVAGGVLQFLFGVPVPSSRKD